MTILCNVKHCPLCASDLVQSHSTHMLSQEGPTNIVKCRRCDGETTIRVLKPGEKI